MRRFHSQKIFFHVTQGLSHAEFSCVPNESYQDECNTCLCSGDGKSAACTLMACISEPTPEATTELAVNATTEEALEHVENSHQVCTPNDVKMQVTMSDDRFQLTRKISLQTFEGLQSLPLCDEWHRLVLHTTCMPYKEWI